MIPKSKKLLHITLEDFRKSLKIIKLKL